MVVVGTRVLKSEDLLKKANLLIVLEEGDPVVASIKEALIQNKIREASIQSIDGKLKNGLIQFMEGNQLKSEEVKDVELLKASGNFKLSANELFGRMNVSTKKGKVYSGTLLKGTAKEGLEIKMSFFK